MKPDAEIYQELALGQAWRAASLMDRNPHSPTRGSFSRTHWGWRFDDFAYPRFQEGVYALARLHGMEYSGNPFFNSQAAAQWIQWGFEYWAGLQHKNGSFDEAYPNEQCLAATAFTGFYLGQAFLLWENRLPESLRERLTDCFSRAGQWLCRNDETHGMLTNHQAAAMAALETAAQICGEQAFSQRAEFFRDKILAAQPDEGWFLEYEGMDVGYGLHGLFYLAWWQKRTGCAKTLEALSRASDFYAFCLHPDGTLGGEYTSRNTEFCFPAGLEMLADECPSARAMAASLRQSLAHRRAAGVYAMDIFNFFPLLNNLFFAMDHAGPLEGAPLLPWQSERLERYFPQAGLWAAARPGYYALIGLAKGGTVSLFDKKTRKLAARHSGLQASMGKKLYTSQDYTPSPLVEWSWAKERAVIKVPWKGLGLPVFSPLKFMAFRMFTITLGRFPRVSQWVKGLLVKVLIKRKKRPQVTHFRTIGLDEQGVEIIDELSLAPGMTGLAAWEQFTSVHMGSSLYADYRSLGPASGSTPLPPAKKLRLRLTAQGSAWEPVEG